MRDIRRLDQPVEASAARTEKVAKHPLCRTNRVISNPLSLG